MSILDGLTQDELLELSNALLCDLDLFELLREPRFVSDAECSRETTLEASGLRDDISCPICCGIIQKCVVIKGCLHRFCSECIETAVRIGAKECPKCRQKVPSRRSLMPDPIYDSIILRLIPNPKVFEEMCQAFVMAFNKGVKDDPTIENIRRAYLGSSQNANHEETSLANSITEAELLSIERAFDKSQCKRVIRKEHKKALNSLPSTTAESLRSCYRLLTAEDGIPQVEPNMLFDDGTITLNHLGMYIKRKIGLPFFQEFYFFNKDPWYVGEPTDTLACIRQQVKHPSHLILTVYYITRHPECIATASQ